MAAKSKEFLTWIEFTLSIGLDAYKDHGRLDSILLEDTAGEQHTIVIDIKKDEFDPDEFLDEARGIVRELTSLQKYAIAWIGTVTLEEDNTVDAVLVEAGERDQQAVVMAQPFKRKKSGGLVASGDLYEISDAENCISDDDTEEGEEAEISVDDSKRLNELVSAIVSEAFQRLEAGKETPFAFVSHADQEARGVYEPESPKGEFCDLVNSVREGVISDEDRYQYAVAYLGTEEVDGELVEGLYVEAGDLHGQAPVYFKRYSMSKSGKVLPAEDIQLYQEGENLWVGDDESEEETSDSPLNDFIQPVFSIAVDRLKEGIDRPFACLANSADEPVSILEPKRKGSNNEKLLDSLREQVAANDEHQMYAIISYTTLKGDGKPKKAMVAECGEREGESPVFALQYWKFKSGKIELAEVEYLREETNLWGWQLDEPAYCDPIESLEDLALRAIHLALKRMQDGDETPFLCVVSDIPNRYSVIETDGLDDFVEFIEELREEVLTCEDARMYAVTYFATTEQDDGSELDIVVAETGDRNGAAPEYHLWFKVSKQLRLTTGNEIELADNLDNLWASSDADD